jgi:Phage tail baseplate hub (GPD)
LYRIHLLSNYPSSTGTGPATVTLELANGTKRYFNGIVGRFTQEGRDVRFTTYDAELFPWLWLLTIPQPLDCAWVVASHAAAAGGWSDEQGL